MGIFWFNLGMLALISIGNAALVIAILNRMHALPWPQWILHRSRQAHDLWIVAFPALIVWFVGLTGPTVLRGGEWRQVWVVLLAYFVVCVVVAAVLPVIAILRWLAMPPACLVEHRETTIDVAERLGYRPVGPGPYHFMTKIPGNELFQLQMSEKQFRLPRLPAAWEGLSILHLSDVHFIGTVQRAYFEHVLELAQQTQPDLIVFTGDLLDRLDLVEWLPHTFGKLSAPLGCYFILGNHDWYLGETTPTRRALEKLGWQDIAGKCVVIQHREQSLAIGGTEVPWIGKHPDFSNAPADAFRLLLSHTPDNIGWARRQRVDLMLAGHNHGGQVRLPLFGPVYSPSAYGCQYAAGVFDEGPTLLHVSRGISGRHPLRWNCLPELPRLILRHPKSAAQTAGSSAKAGTASKHGKVA